MTGDPATELEKLALVHQEAAQKLLAAAQALRAARAATALMDGSEVDVKRVIEQKTVSIRPGYHAGNAMKPAPEPRYLGRSTDGSALFTTVPFHDYRKMSQWAAAEHYINSADRPVDKHELFKALEEGGARVSSPEALSVALSRHDQLLHLKGQGWATHRVMMSMTKKSLLQQFHDTKNPKTSPEQADPEE